MQKNSPSRTWKLTRSSATKLPVGSVNRLTRSSTTIWTSSSMLACLPHAPAARGNESGLPGCESQGPPDAESPARVDIGPRERSLSRHQGGRHGGTWTLPDGTVRRVLLPRGSARGRRADARRPRHTVWRVPASLVASGGVLGRAEGCADRDSHPRRGPGRVP